LSAAGSAEALQGGMTRMMRLTPQERRDLGEQARDLVVERFSLDKVLDRWEQLYANLLRENSNYTRRPIVTLQK
jgi:glycosyltransferase involved in cell wall biosynthesis